MDEDLKALERGLRDRRAELQALIAQMQTDKLNSSSVFQHLKEELQIIEQKLNTPSDRAKN